jgi:hypothetical protein
MYSRSKLWNGLIAGLIAITVNTLLLKCSPLLHIKAEGGGLLKLLLKAGRYITVQPPFLHKTLFGLIFHYLTGLFMALMYVYWFSPLLKLAGWIKGSLFSLLPWAINSFIVLPLLGQGWLGNNQLPSAGIIYFFVTNWIFGLILGWLNDLFMQHSIK